MAKFSKKATKFEYDDPNAPKRKEFQRVIGDNSLFKEIQVTDVKTVTDRKTKWMLDADGIIYKACSSVEDRFIVVSHRGGEIPDTELKGITEFKGRGNVISENSWLGMLNTKRAVKGEQPLAAEDFEVSSGQRLKYKSEAAAMEAIKISIFKKLKDLRTQFKIDIIVLCIGSGECFRHKLETIKLYKAERQKLSRPILLNKIRDWVLELETKVAPAGFETDDYVEWYGLLGYKAYKKSGIFSYGVIAEDKDAMGKPKLLINYGMHSGEDNPLKGTFKYPNAWIIDEIKTSIGGLDLVKKSNVLELKGFGLKWIIAQAFLIGDSADCYHALKDHPTKTNYGATSAYRDFNNIEDATELLNTVNDLYFNFFPYGVQYTSHTGKAVDIPTLEYMNIYFRVAYMTSNPDDTLDYARLCKVLGADTSQICDNNKLTPPVKCLSEDAFELTEGLVTQLDSTVKEDFKGISAMKKGQLIDKLKHLQSKLSEMSNEINDTFFTEKQFKK